MNYEKLSSFSFWDKIDSALTEKRFSGKRRLSLYPSEASVIATDPKSGKKTVIGGCSAKTIYRMTGIPESDPPQIKSQYIFAFGVQLENFITELAKKGFIYDNNSAKFFDAESAVSGEIDLIVQHPEGGIILVECKSTYGYYKEKQLMDHHEGRGANKVLVKGRPQDAHLLQLGVYLFIHRDYEDLVGGKLVYILRDNMSRCEYNVHLAQVETAQGTKTRLYVNGQEDVRFYMEDVFDRYNEIKQKVIKIRKGEAIEVERDYDLIYSKNKIESIRSDRQFWDTVDPSVSISDTEYEKYVKNPDVYPIGSWQCS